MKPLYLLVINPGSTSMKLALYENERSIFEERFSYSSEQIAQYKKMAEQFDMRLEGVRAFVKKLPVPEAQLSAIVSRGGLTAPLKPGAYAVCDLLVDRVLNRPYSQHASNLGAPLAATLAKELGIPAYVYDGVTVNELQPVAYPTGFAGIVRVSRVHVLNMRATLILEAERLGKKPEDLNVIVAHIGGGITLGIFESGRMIDVVNDTEGPFTPERCGRVPLHPLTKYCKEYGITPDDLFPLLRGHSGVSRLLGTNDALEVERKIDEGDKMAALVYEAMAYQVAKSIGELATVVFGRVDRIVLTGAIAHSKRFTKAVADRVRFIADVDILPGEDEMGALARGALRVLRGEEEVHCYTRKDDEWEQNFKLEDLLEEYQPSI